jgi:hypothetical protein
MVLPTVSRRSIISRRCGDIPEVHLAPDHGSDLFGHRHLLDLPPHPQAINARQEVHAQAVREAWIVDEGKADANDVEVAVNARLLQADRLFLQGDVGRETHDEMSSVAAIVRNVSLVTCPPTESNARSTPRPFVTSSTYATKSSGTVVDGMVSPGLDVVVASERPEAAAVVARMLRCLGAQNTGAFSRR